MERQNKVYINPNFKNSATSSTMHINRNFPQPTTVMTSKSKVFVNPNFRTNITPSSVELSKNTYTEQKFNTNVTYTKEETPFVYKSRYGLVNKPKSSASIENPSNLDVLPIRCILNPNMIQPSFSSFSTPQEALPQQSKTVQRETVSINKYKSVSIRDVKKNMETNVPRVKNKYSLGNSASSSYKVMRNIINTSLVNKSQFKLSNIPVQKKIIFKHPRTKIAMRPTKSKNKVLIKKLKKNNIPCPLFRKYGKCVRTEAGQCEYLHDKKHVALCRKFMKGLCFDATCLLSHELSNKKMPICHFFLKGACSKDNCPYLHVKMNKNTKICSDFLSGYCERGDQCSKLHVNKLKKEKIQNNKTRRTKRVEKPKFDVNEEKSPPLIESNDPNIEEGRYYNESLNKSDDTLTIKPSRCKLGTLPSYIKL